MKQQKQAKSIDSYITNVIEESVKSTLQRRALQEKEKQALVGETQDEEPEQFKSKDVENAKLEKGEIVVDDIIDKLNSIRSGKSFKDEKIASALGKYFDDLDTAEKTALLAFLKGISQVVTGEISPDVAMEPGSPAPSVEMEKTSGPKKVSIKPNVIKAPSIEKSKKKSSEDSSGPVPITPK